MNEGKEFEVTVQRLLKLMGLSAELTGYSQDGGIDITAVNHSPISGGKYIVQCKKCAAPVGEPVVRDLFGTLHAAGASKGILITTSSFTAAAKRFAQGKPIELIDGTAFHALCDQYGLSIHCEAPLADDEVFHAGSKMVRITSINCTDTEERTRFQHYVFTTGTLIIDTEINYRSPGAGSFGFNYFRITRTHSVEDGVAAFLELTIVDDFTDNYRNKRTFVIKFEGQPETIGSLKTSAKALLGKQVSPNGSKSGCFTLLFGISLCFMIALLVWTKN